MNGYDAQDMAAQGADGFRNGYQAGYADAVKAIEAAQPAAAQEAVGWFTDDYLTDKSATTYDPLVAERWRNKGWPVTALYAAPVTAAPEASYFEYLDRYNHSLRRAIHAMMAKLVFLLDEDQFADIEAIALAAGVTPAAPGIDLEQFRALARGAIDALTQHQLYPADVDLAVSRLRDLLALIIRTSIDANPKGALNEQFGSAEGFNVGMLVRDCCEAERADPDHPFTICISVNALTEIARQHALADSPKGGSEAAWDDCKVAFGFDGDEDAIFDAWKRGQLSLPSGWTFSETDGAGARLVAVFRVDGMPSPQDGETVRRMLDVLSKAQAGDAEVQP